MNVRQPGMLSSAATKGFTLMEMLVIAIIIAMLAAIAYPSYSSQVRKTRRTDAMEALMYIQQLQEKYRVHHAEYGSLAQIGYPGALAAQVLSEQGHYSLMVSHSTATGYVATATAIGVQAVDSGCATLAIEVSASYPRGERQSTGGEVCWQY